MNFVEICRNLKSTCRILDSTNGVVLMAERIAEEKINQIRQAVDIVEVISDYVQLKKQGRNYFGLCPFHGESTPSFSVSIDKQIFHCFGCGAGGNVFSFLMELEGLSFQETAIKLLISTLKLLYLGGTERKRFQKSTKLFLEHMSYYGNFTITCL
jgi:DNA primase